MSGPSFLHASMPKDLAAALCLVFVLEGLLLFAVPRFWRDMMRRATEMTDQQIRISGAAAIIAGVLALMLVRGVLGSP